ncbi:MAG: hypothetical protein ABI573_08165 [Chloroflexota bacterium]
MRTTVRRFGQAFGAAMAGAIMLMLLLASQTSVVMAANPPAPVLGTRITLSNPGDVVIGTSVIVTARLTTLGGQALPVSRVTMEVNGVLARATRTDATGKVDLSLSSEYVKSAATLNIRVAFAGDSTHGASVALTTIVIRSATIDVVTVPAVVGLSITLGDQELLTDTQGIATFAVKDLGRLRLTPRFDLPESSGVRVGFVRWNDEIFDPVRTIDVVGDARLTLGVRLAYRTSMRFVDPDGNIVDPALIQSVVMETSSGPTRTVTSYNEVWLEAAVPVKRTFGLVAVPNIHRVSEVNIAGTNVVNRGQQTWEPTLDGVLTVEVLLYHLDIRVEDALLKSAIVTRVTLEYPDGTMVTHDTTKDGKVSFGALPRGDYRIVVHASGIVPPSPIALSRPQDTTIRIISNMDMSIAGGLILLVILSLVVLGRGHQLVALGKAGLVRTDSAGRGFAQLMSRSDRGVQRTAQRTDAWVQERTSVSRSAQTSDSTVAAPGPLRDVLVTLFGSVDRVLQQILTDPRRRLIMAAVGLAVMALLVLAMASTLLGASPPT